jgi:hypothetical protein
MYTRADKKSFRFHSSKKLGWTVMLLIVAIATSCVRASIVARPSSPALSSKRLLRVALFLADQNRMTPGFLPAVERAFQKFEGKTGIGIGAYTTVEVNLSGVVTQSQVYRRLRKAWSSMDPGAFDIGICYAPRVYIEDVLAIIAGVVVINTADASDGRFMVIRTLDPDMIEHELGHLFCAMDGLSPEENLKWVLANKDRRYDSRGWGMCKNVETAYPERPLENPWSPEEYAGVVERAKARAKSLETATEIVSNARAELK